MYHNLRYYLLVVSFHLFMYTVITWLAYILYYTAQLRRNFRLYLKKMYYKMNIKVSSDSDERVERLEKKWTTK